MSKAGEKCLVLVIDDDDALRESICDVLSDEGFTTTQAADGAQGLTQATARKPDLILLDLMMPTMNGWQFRAAQKLDPALASIPVVVLTASGNVQRSSVDAEMVLFKPVKLDDLLAAVVRYC